MMDREKKGENPCPRGSETGGGGSPSRKKGRGPNSKKQIAIKKRGKRGGESGLVRANASAHAGQEGKGRRVQRICR